MARRNFLTPINLVNLTADPISGVKGDIYYNTADEIIKVFSNSSWIPVGNANSSQTTVSETAPENPEIGDSWYVGSTGSFYIWDGSFWVEVNGVVSGTNSFATFSVSGQDDVVADIVNDTLTFISGTNISIATDATTDSITINADDAATVKHQVKLGESISKGQAVYVSSAVGTNMIVSKASNTTETTSSKTMGLLQSGGATNDFDFVITEGLLTGLNTSDADNEGDPVWLGTSGNLIYGLTNKPVAPAHLVFIGIVTRKSATVGEIFVKIQNGFELQELHNVGIGYSPSIADNEVLAYDNSSSLWINKTADEANIVDKTSSQTISGTKTFSGNISLNSVAVQNTNVQAITTTDATTIYTLSTSYSSAEFLVQATQTGGKKVLSKLLMVNDGTNISLTQYGITELGSPTIPLVLSATISGSNLLLQATVSDANTTNATIRVVATAIVA